MSLPGFEYLKSNSAGELCKQISDRVRLERRKLKLTQKEFASLCGIPLRTFKRFELGECDSLEAFIRIIMVFDRVAALELLFPARMVSVDSRIPTAMLERLIDKLDHKQ